MSKIKQKIIQAINSKLSNNNAKPLTRLFLNGVLGQLQINYSKPYGYYLSILSFIATFCLAKYLISYKTNQMDIKGYNWFVPNYVYSVREESHIYWEVVRLAKKMPTTFTYYQWDDNLMYQINRKGQQTPFHSHRAIQNTQTFASPLHQYNFPSTSQNHAKIMMYLKNINNPYDLKNYLRSKPINIGDWIRTGYYMIYRQLGLTNRWRYDEFVSKPDIYYRWQKLKLSYRISKDRRQLYNTLDKLKFSKEDVWTFLFWFL